MNDADAPLIAPGAVVEMQERVDASGKVVAELDVAVAPLRGIGDGGPRPF